MTTIVYKKGDATKPESEKKKLIIHVCNNIGKWGKGFVLALSKKWKEPEKDYREMNKYKLGDVKFIKVTDDIVIANMIAQDGINRKGTPFICRINYVALEACLEKVKQYAEDYNLSVHMPKIGCGLGGGDWNIIQEIIRKKLDELDIYVYNFDE